MKKPDNSAPKIILEQATNLLKDQIEANRKQEELYATAMIIIRAIGMWQDE